MQYKNRLKNKKGKSLYIAIRLYNFIREIKVEDARYWPEWIDLRCVEGIYSSLPSRRYKDRIVYSN